MPTRDTMTAVADVGGAVLLNGGRVAVVDKNVAMAPGAKIRVDLEAVRQHFTFSPQDVLVGAKNEIVSPPDGECRVRLRTEPS